MHQLGHRPTPTATARTWSGGGSGCTPSAAPTSSWPPSSASRRTRDGTGFAVDSSPDYGRQRSLKRLGVAHIDLYYLHRADPAVPIEKAVAVMKEFVGQVN